MGKEVKEEQNRLKGCVVSSFGIPFYYWRKTTLWLSTGREQRHQRWQKMSSASSSPTTSVAAESDALRPLVWKMPDLQFKQVFPK